MARCFCICIIRYICFFTCFYYVKCRINKVNPSINSVTVLSRTVYNVSADTGVKYLIQIQGCNFNPHMIIRPTTVTGDRGKHCIFKNENENNSSMYILRPRIFNETVGFLIWVPLDYDFRKPLYLCVQTADSALNSSISTYKGSLIKWTHQGQNVFLLNDNKPAKFDGTSSNLQNSSESCVGERRNRRELLLSDIEDEKIDENVQSDASTDKRRLGDDNGPRISINALRVESSDYVPVYKDGVLSLLAQSSARFRLFGEGLTSSMQIAFTTIEGEGGGICEFPSADIFRMVEGSVTNYSAVTEIRVPFRTANDLPYFLCVKEGSTGNETVEDLRKKPWRHQGSEKWLQFRVYERLLPVWVTIIIIVMLLFFSALFSGLTLGLMSMDKTDLKILCTTGTDLERQYASAIMPVRSHGSLLLCSLLLGNVLVNSVLTILMDDLTSGLIAVIFSTLAIVIFGEIMPQAICSRYGLAVGAKTIYITKFVILLTFVVAYPISKILDYMLGEEIGNVYNRERLKELVKTGTDIEKDEVNIISGALELRKKTVSDVMTKLEDIYMLDYEAILDFQTVSEIMKSGFSRIPVFDGRRSNIVSMLFIKDLAFVDPDDNTPLKQLCDFYQNLCYFVFEDLTLDVLFKQFKDGNKGHMAFVNRVNAEGEGDPFYETIGLVTLEDVIEELIQAEIVDETDVFTDNRSKRKRDTKHAKQDFTTFCERRENQRIHISPQLTLATFQYLSTTVDAFKPNSISETILRRLLKQDVIYQIKVKNKEKGKSDPSTVIYEKGKPVDYFVLILEGRVEVIVGREEMKFESGPFTYFGCQALVQNIGVGGDSPTTAVPSSNASSLQSVSMDTISRHTFVPDYTVRALTEVFYVRIKRSLYLAAKRATLLENSQKTDDHFDDEVDKLLHSLDEDDRSQGQGSQDSPVLNRNAAQGDKESLQRFSAPLPESPRSLQPSTKATSPQEPNGSVRTPLSPVLKIIQDKLVPIDSSDKTSPSESVTVDLEERTNLLRTNDEIS